jgi:prepilin-type processing-associated H-X9-DG protein
MCKNNLGKLGLAIRAYHDLSAADEKQQFFPPSRIADGYATWAVLIAPHLFKSHPLQKWDPQQSYFAQTKDVREATTIFQFCPTRVRLGSLSEIGDLDAAGNHVAGALGDYASVAGDGSTDWTGPNANGALVSAIDLERKGDRIVGWKSLTSVASLKRGQSYTLLIGEKHVPSDRMGDAAVGDGTLYSGQHPASFSRVLGVGFPLAAAIDAPFNHNFGSYHVGVCNFSMADGSVRALNNERGEAVLGHLARRGD